jgi:hypothetical protein
MKQEFMNAEDNMYYNDVMKVNVSRRPNWWLNIVYDYEDNVLGGRDKEYPAEKIYQVQHLERYGFITDPVGKFAIFANPSDYIDCILKFGGNLK